MTTTALAIERAWRLAGAHGHHWASDATPEALALGRSILRDHHWLAGAPLHDALGELLELPEYGAWVAASQERARRSEAPRTEDEARVLEALPTCIGGGIGYALSHVTASGRTRWAVDPRTADTTIEIWRPAGLCLRLVVSGRERVTVEVTPGPITCETRHVEAASYCLTALRLPGLDPASPMLADDDGRTPAWRDIRYIADVALEERADHRIGAS